MNTKIFVTAKFKVQKEKLVDAIELMKNLTTITQTEEGCLEYYYLQNIEDESEFTSYEIWESSAYEGKHWATDHVQNALKELPNLLVIAPEIIKWKTI